MVNGEKGAFVLSKEGFGLRNEIASLESFRILCLHEESLTKKRTPRKDLMRELLAE